jgi:hypothetical protein
MIQRFYTIFIIFIYANIYNSNTITHSGYHFINLKNLVIFIIQTITITFNMVMFTAVSNLHTSRFLCCFNIAAHNLQSFSESYRQLGISKKQFTIFQALKSLPAKTDKHNKNLS